jgi:hypothetical protein
LPTAPDRTVQILQRAKETCAFASKEAPALQKEIEAADADPKVDMILVKDGQLAAVEESFGTSADPNLDVSLVQEGQFVSRPVTTGEGSEEKAGEYDKSPGSSVQSSAAADYVEVSLSLGSSANGLGQETLACQEMGQSVQSSWEASADTLMDGEHSPLESYIGHNVDMQLVRRSRDANGDQQAVELSATNRVKEFCCRILKALAPPLLREVQSAITLRADATPFTPRRSMRCAAATPAKPPGKSLKKASAAEGALIKALGINVEGLKADDAAVQELKEIFDSPLRETQLNVLAAIFGKTMPPRDEIMRMGALEVSVSA